ncbi:alcohol dehydrogenase [Pullulanibacillus camelliae]|uniref:Alcohol dehydrogenase n=1 Tax=Pullulanibacillus camelliae TaxID=1707096 RepID=A0A8J2YCH8_9BACL|nr:iron-containing alcohol dehydrogenase [Pullulanibacillus camelliae]GGE30760.1 alcohol dehydrogenase [Pullulanibacillus camelliae]
MQDYSYFCQTRIEMGFGQSQHLPALLAASGVKGAILLVTDPGIAEIGVVDPIRQSLEAAGYQLRQFDRLSQNPRDTECMEGARLFIEMGAEVVIAIGGGSAMDTGKAIALLGKNGGTPLDYIEGRKCYERIAPVICLPTTAGTGSEVTRSAVITEESTHRKLTLKHEQLRPRLAILDPSLTLTVPPSVTAATGVDALVHAIEGSTCKVTHPIAQAFGARAMQTIISALPSAYKEGQNKKARFAMMEGSLLAGLCFGSTDVAAVHCLAEALGGLYDTPHGIANAVFLPYVLAFNAEGEPSLHAKLSRLMNFAREADSNALAVEKLIHGIHEWTAALQIPKLKDLPKVEQKDFPRLIELAMQNSSTPSNSRTITAADYQDIIEAAYDGGFRSKKRLP